MTIFPYQRALLDRLTDRYHRGGVVPRQTTIFADAPRFAKSKVTVVRSRRRAPHTDDMIQMLDDLARQGYGRKHIVIVVEDLVTDMIKRIEKNLAEAILDVYKP